MTPTFETLPIGQIVSSLTNPRKTFNPVKLAELAESIKASGVHQPILVRPLPGSRVADTDRGITHEIISGERRWRASQLAGVATIPAMIRDMADDAVLECQIVENLQRDDLTELEEAEGYRVLMQAGALTVDVVATKIGKSRSYVFGRLKLLDLCIEARTSLRAGDIDFSRALLLARIPDHKLQIQALERIAAKSYAGDLAMGYRGAASYVQSKFMLYLDRARFDILDATLLPDAGPCNTCHKRTGHEPDLFADVKNADVCTDPGCYRAKDDAQAAALLAAAQLSGKTVIEGREAKSLYPNNWGAIEGYLRLDDPIDSPTGQPLRKLLGKQLEASGVQTTLLKNPHKDGELIDMLPAATVAQLLAATQHAADGERIANRLQESKKHQAAAAKAQTKSDYEQAWRTLLLERTWAGIRMAQMESNGADTLSTRVIRHIARHFAMACNGDRAKRLCQILELGKIAPKQALLDHVDAVEHPQAVLQLLIMQADVGYQPHMAEHYPGEPANVGLMLIADDYLIDVDLVKADCKTALRAKLSKSTNPDTTDTPAAQAKGAGWQGQKSQTPVAPGGGAPLRKRKLSAPEAQAAISAAMQGQDTDPGADAQGNDGDTSQPVAESDSGKPLSAPSLAVGVRVRVARGASRLPTIKQKWAGKVGTITQQLGDRAWLVAFEGRVSALASFDQSELTILTALPPCAAPSRPAGRPIAYRGPNGETWSGRGKEPRRVTSYIDRGGSVADIRVSEVPA